MSEINIVERKIYLLAHSQPAVKGSEPDMLNARIDYLPMEVWTERDIFPTQANVMEFAGRLCYDAFLRKREETREIRDYLGNIMDQVHLSVLEHSSFTFLLSNVSRAATHEIVRHRHLSFSQESQRFVHGRKRDVVLPEKMAQEGVDFLEAEAEVLTEAFARNEKMYRDLKEQGFTHKEAAEAARSLLPNAAATNIVVTGNARSWKEFIEKRIAPGADAELQAISREILEHLENVLPEVFDEEARSHWDGEEVQHGTKH